MLAQDSSALEGSIEWIASEECVLKGIPDKQRLWRAA
jgi:hypothetical protein